MANPVSTVDLRVQSAHLSFSSDERMDQDVRSIQYGRQRFDSGAADGSSVVFVVFASIFCY